MEVKKLERTICPECGNQVDNRNYVLECDYCLSKKEE
nr:YhfH family protein [Virgibacillus doumboii]